MPAPEWQTGTIIDVADLTPSVRSFRIAMNNRAHFNFKPGQFVTLNLPIDDRPGKGWRSYSIASCPDGSNMFELIVVQLRGGQGSGYLFEDGKPGLELQIRGPLGRFVLPEKIERDILFVCTGTGVAPFRSMLQFVRQRAVPHQKLWLIFGSRTQADLLYYEEFLKLEQQLEGFSYIPTLSREEWTGRTGYVHPIYEEICAGQPDVDFYLCGWRMMIDEAKKRIAALGYDRKHIHQELYG